MTTFSHTLPRDARALERQLACDRVATKRIKLDLARRKVAAARRELMVANEALRRIADRAVPPRTPPDREPLA